MVVSPSAARKWFLGVGATVAATVVGAMVVAGPETVTTWMDSHNDGRYLLVMDYRSQMFQQELSNYRREADTLEWRKSQAQTAEEKRLLDQQLKNLQSEKKDYIEQFKLEPVK